jgi:hypothetical protein
VTDDDNRDLIDKVRNAFGRVFARAPGPTAAMRAHPSVWSDGNDELVCVTMSVREAQGFVEVMANDHGVLRDAGIVEPWRRASTPPGGLEPRGCPMPGACSCPPGGLSEEERRTLHMHAHLLREEAFQPEAHVETLAVINRLLSAAPPPASSPAPGVPPADLADEMERALRSYPYREDWERIVGGWVARLRAAPVAPLKCSGLTARWCARCGTCVCPAYGSEAYEDSGMSDPRCPLHAPTSQHAEEAAPVAPLTVAAALMLPEVRPLEEQRFASHVVNVESSIGDVTIYRVWRDALGDLCIDRHVTIGDEVWDWETCRLDMEDLDAPATIIAAPSTETGAGERAK